MKFVVERTSTCYYSEPPEPCTRASLEEVEKWNEKTKAWTIEIDSLEVLMSFVEGYAPIILSRDKFNIPCIEIYDDYRE